jgi:hypothetical protein
MTDLTPLDRAHAEMQMEQADDAARLGFYERLADAELFLLLQADPVPGEDNVTPELFELEDGRYVLVFDREDRLAQFVGKPTPYLRVSGRVIAQMLAGQGIGLGVNLDVAPSSILLPAGAVGWLHDTLGHAPDAVEARIVAVHKPAGLPDRLIRAIDTKLATAMGLARCAYLVGARYDSGARGHLLAFVGAVPEAEGALATAASEALTFSGIEAGAMDVGFFQTSDAIVQRMETVGLRFDLPQPENVQHIARPAPGSDPDKPPILK